MLPESDAQDYILGERGGLDQDADVAHRIPVCGNNLRVSTHQISVQYVQASVYLILAPTCQNRTLFSYIYPVCLHQVPMFKHHWFSAFLVFFGGAGVFKNAYYIALVVLYEEFDTMHKHQMQEVKHRWPNNPWWNGSKLIFAYKGHLDGSKLTRIASGWTPEPKRAL